MERRGNPPETREEWESRAEQDYADERRREEERQRAEDEENWLAEVRQKRERMDRVFSHPSPIETAIREPSKRPCPLVQIELESLPLTERLAGVHTVRRRPEWSLKNGEAPYGQELG